MNKPTAPLSLSKKARLILEDGSVFPGISVGYESSVAGEVVFNTGMVGYPETLTDPSYFGQILTLTYPLVGNYGVPPSKSKRQLESAFESTKIQVAALLMADYSELFHHWNARQSLSDWLVAHQVPALSGIDTRALTKKLREKGTMLGKILLDDTDIEFYDPDRDHLVQKVSIQRKIRYEAGKKTVALIDCGCKHNIIRHFLRRNISVLRVPWDADLSVEKFDGLFISNGPGDPKMCRKTLLQIRQAFDQKIPTLGICLGHQLMALAAGANTFKLKYGHRGQNQPVIEVGADRCLITSQNHSFAVDNQTLPAEWKPWFVNLNDGTNEGLRHTSGLFFSVQFHPEASPGPVDAEFVFDKFADMVKR